MMNEQDDKREALITDTVVVTEAETPTIWKHLYQALARRLVEIANEPSATTRMIDYDRVARAHEEEEADDLITPDQIVLENRIDDMAAWLGVKRD